MYITEKYMVMVLKSWHKEPTPFPQASVDQEKISRRVSGLPGWWSVFPPVLWHCWTGHKRKIKVKAHLNMAVKTACLAVCLLNDNWPLFFGELATGDVKQEGENEAAIISGPQQPAACVKCQRQNAANKTASSTLSTGTASTQCSNPEVSLWSALLSPARGENAMVCKVSMLLRQQLEFNQVLSQWAHFTVCRFICVCILWCFCFTLHSCCITVSTVGWSDGIEVWPLGTSFLQCSDTVGWVILIRKNPSPIRPIMCLVGC